jgi:hypothetical protein
MCSWAGPERARHTGKPAFASRRFTSWNSPRSHFVGRVVLQPPVPELLHLDLRRSQGQHQPAHLDVPFHRGRDVVRHRRDQVAARQDGQQAHEVGQLQHHPPVMAFFLQQAVEGVLAALGTHHHVAGGEELLERHASLAPRCCGRRRCRHTRS